MAGIGDRRTKVSLVLGLTLAAVATELVGHAVTPVAASPSARTVGAPSSTTFTSLDPTVASALTEETSRPNIVLFMADDMRYDDLTFMPQLRRLVRRTGTDFKNSFSPYPLCCPARASFLTGKAARNHRVLWHEKPYGFRAFDDSTSIATALRRAGYRSGFLGKYLNGYGAQRSKVTGRISTTYVPAGWARWMAAVDRPSGASWSGHTYNLFNTAYNVDGRVDTTHRGEYQTNTLGAATRSMVSGLARRTEPFFVFASFVAPHHAGPPESDDPPLYVRASNGTMVHVPTTARPGWVRGRFDDVIRRGAGIPVGGGPVEADMTDKPHRFRLPEPNKAERRALREVTRQRAEALYVLDRQVGRTVEHLKRIGEWRRTVFVFTSDNGYYLGEHRKRSGKVTAHEPSLRVPLLMTGPGIPQGVARYDPVTTMDLTATIADLAGATTKFPYALDGMSMLPAIRGGDRGWVRPVITEAVGPLDGTKRTWRVRGFPEFDDRRGSIGLRTARYKVTVYASGFVELYDLAIDPLEMEGVQEDPAYAEVKQTMLDLWWQYKDCRAAECTAPLPPELVGSTEDTKVITDHQVRQRIERYGR